LLLICLPLETLCYLALNFGGDQSVPRERWSGVMELLRETR